MAVQTSYPGVYVQEVPSGVRTITGVSTSIALFLGRIRQGPLNEPVLCLNYSDFERVFSSDVSYSDLSRAVRLFFINGGTQCYVMRIANGARSASITLRNVAKTEDVLKISAKNAGEIGDTIRFAISYNTPQPESTFNLEVFRWDIVNGQQIPANVEVWPSLSMDPDNARFVDTVINQGSKLIETTSKVPAGIPAPGYSRSGRPLRPADADFLHDFNAAFVASTHDSFRISVDGLPFKNITLTGIDTVAGTPTTIMDAIETSINTALPAGNSVTVSSSPITGGNLLLDIQSAAGDVRIEPAASNDIARALMLGTAQGGVEISAYANTRPAPNGLVFDIEDLGVFSGQRQDSLTDIIVNGTTISLTNTLITTTGADLMYKDGQDSAANGGNNGVRQKLSIIAGAINSYRDDHPDFRWTAQVWGSRLAIIPGYPGDNNIGTISSTTYHIQDSMIQNVRYYSLGTGGTSDFQNAATSAGGNDGSAPKLNNFRAAFPILDREIDLFNLMILPQDVDHSDDDIKELWGPASVFCQQRRAFLLIDPPKSWGDVGAATDQSSGVNDLRIGLVKDYSAIFYPRVTLRENGKAIHVGPAGAIAGLMARIDTTRGVWKAPAGTEADIRGINGLEHRFSDGENGVLNPHAVNTLRIFPNGIVNWGARTMDGDNDFASEYKYIPIRRTALYIEESLYRGLKWVVFEPNDEPLWAQIRLNVGAFMHNLFRQGAFQGVKKDDAYFVKCDKETTTQNDINLGIVNVWVGFAPLKPAEFVILYLQQMTGQIQV